MAASPGDAKVPIPVRFGFAAMAGIGATCCVHPLDVLRVHLQLDAEGGGKRMYRGMADVAIKVARTSGIAHGWYAGLSAGLLRQVTYGMPRIAMFTILLERFGTPEGGGEASLGRKMVLGMAAGACGGLFGNPSEVCLVRMTADIKQPPELRRNYKGIANALVRIVREEGPRALFSGLPPTLARAVLISSGQMAVYSEAKSVITTRTGLTGIPLQTAASFVGAFAGVALSCPADVIKSRLQNAKPGQYAGMLDCGRVLLQKEGIFSLWKGFGPSWIKVTPHTVVSFVILDNLTRYFYGRAAM
eukprot:m.57018 g.57018  ORF g.57018 m.57018 type:complete len:302 (+) comp7048_c0_seq4:89-994(+)